MLQLRIPDASWSSQEVTLEDKNLIVELKWNSRNSSWAISLFDLAEDPIVTGIIIRENTNITGIYTDSRLPSGNLYCLRVNFNADKLTRDNLGTDFLLAYATAEEEADAIV